MLKHTSCCVPLCTNNFRNFSGLTFYRIPKEKSIRREYVRLIWNENLKLESNSTRICSAHWSGGKKLSRNHLPSIFPWSKEKTERRILSRAESIASSKKRRVNVFMTEMDEGLLLNIENCMQDADSIPAPSFSDAETKTEMTGELLDRIEAELNQIRDEKEKVVKERDELIKESKRLQHLMENPKFDISTFKDRDEDIEFYTVYPTGVPFCFYMIWSMIRHSA